MRNWEVGRNAPAQWQWPAVVRFLGYVPFSTGGDLRNKLEAYRRLNGFSQARLAAILAIDPSTVWHWERKRSRPNPKHLALLHKLLIASDDRQTGDQPEDSGDRSVPRGSHGIEQGPGHSLGPWRDAMMV